MFKRLGFLVLIVTMAFTVGCAKKLVIVDTKQTEQSAQTTKNHDFKLVHVPADVASDRDAVHGLVKANTVGVWRYSHIRDNADGSKTIFMKRK